MTEIERLRADRDAAGKAVDYTLSAAEKTCAAFDAAYKAALAAVDAAYKAALAAQTKETDQ